MLWVGAYIQPRGSPMSNSYTYVYLIGSLLFVPIWALLFWRSPASDRKSTRLNSSHGYISYAVFCLKKKKNVKILHILKEHAKKEGLNLENYNHLAFGDEVMVFSVCLLIRPTLVTAIVLSYQPPPR